MALSPAGRIKVKVLGGRGSRGEVGPRGRDNMTIARRAEIELVEGQTEFTVPFDYIPDIVEVVLPGSELLREDFSAPGDRKIILNQGVEADCTAIVKAFSLPNGGYGDAFNVDDYGAKGDGITDDTPAINACLLAAGEGAIINFRPGGDYRINGNYQGVLGFYGGVKIAHNYQVLMLNGAQLRLFASPAGAYSIIQGYDVHGWQVHGPGLLIGDREIHTASGGEFGHGVTLFACDDVVLSNFDITQTWGDGVTTLPRYNNNNAAQIIEDYCYRNLYEHLHIWKASRNGISPIASRNSTIRDCTIHDIDRTAPMAAIDFEPDSGAHPNMDCTVDNVRCWNVELGVAVTVANQRIRITNCNLKAQNSAFLAAAGCFEIDVDNCRLENTRGNTEGGAVRFIGSNASQCSVTNCRMYGGGYFLIETNGGDNVDFRENRLYPTNTGCYGPARILGPGCFEDNISRMASNTGVSGVQFIQLHCQFARNSYFYSGTTTVGASILNGADLGGEYYGSPLLKRPNGSTGLPPQVLRASKEADATLGPIGPGATGSLGVFGVDCLNNTVLINVQGNGENGSDRYSVGAIITEATNSGCTIQIKNMAGAAQTISSRIIIASGK